MKAVKGGAYDFKRTDCHTEAKNTAADFSRLIVLTVYGLVPFISVSTI